MKKAKINFNGVEKVIEITEEFHTEFRILGEMSDIWLEESKAILHLEKYKKTPFIYLPDSVKAEILKETKADIAFDNMTEKYTASLINVIEKSFNIKVNNNAFFSESYEPSAEDVSSGIVMVEIGNDK